MSNHTSISIMFEEIKKGIKNIETNTSNKPDIQMDLSDLKVHINQSEERILNRLEQAKNEKKKINRCISFDIKSSWVVFTIGGLTIFLITLLIFCYNLKQINNKLVDNDLKYRYIKMHNHIDSTGVYKLEDVFNYNWNKDSIRHIKNKVEKFEFAVLEQARHIEQARLNQEEANKFEEEAQKQKTK